jgi:hypothetical protein
MRSENAMRITVVPTREKVTIGEIEFRVFEGQTSSGIPIKLMGLFKIDDGLQRLQFVESVCAVDVGDPPAVPLIRTPDMVSGA